MPCSPRAAMRLMAQTTSCWLPQMELVVPKRMSGLTGSSGLRDAAADMVDGATKLAAAAMPDKASAENTNSRLFVRRSVILTGMGVPSLLAQEIFCTHPAAEWKPPVLQRVSRSYAR